MFKKTISCDKIYKERSGKMNWLEIAKKYENEFIKITTELLKIPTLLDEYNPDNKEAPFGKDIRKALDTFLDIAKQDGFKVKNIDNYAGHIEIGEGDEIIGILGHLDVVPVGGQWKHPPFSATLEDGKIYARGAMDDKGPSVAAYIAMKMLKDNDIKINKKIRLILGCDEETGMRGLDYYLKHEKMPDIGFAPDAEFPLIYAEKGIFNFDFLAEYEDELIESMNAGERYNVVPDECTAVLKKDLKSEFIAYINKNNIRGRVENNTYTTFGHNAHAATPEKGVNAIYLMVDFLKEHSQAPFIKFIAKYLNFDHYGKNLGLAITHKEMKNLTNNLGFIKYDGKFVHLGCNMRYPINYDFANGEKIMETAAKEFSLEYRGKLNHVPHYISPEDPLIKTLHKAYIKYTGDTKTEIMTIGGGTYARQLKKAVAFGAAFPGAEELAHQPDEYLDIKEMLKAIAIYAESLENLSSGK